MNFRTTFLYDNAGNRTSVEDANGKIWETVYFANRNQAQATVDAMGFRTSYVYDLQGRLQSTQDANGHFVTNVYDSMGRLQFVKNALGENARQYGYDLVGRMVTASPFPPQSHCGGPLRSRSCWKINGGHRT